MHTHAVHIRRSTPHLLARFAWVPLCVVFAAVAFSMISGHSLTRGAGASTVQVQGDYATGVYLDTTACSAGAGAIGDIIPGTDSWRTAQDATSQVCQLSFGTPGDPAGADLQMLDDPSVLGVAGPALRCTTGGCAGHSIADYSNSAEPAANTSAFGAQLVGSPGGAAAAVWTGAPAVHDVNDTADVACHTASTADGNCSFTWGVTAAATDIPGSYVAHAQALVVAR